MPVLARSPAGCCPSYRTTNSIRCAVLADRPCPPPGGQRQPGLRGNFAAVLAGGCPHRFFYPHLRYAAGMHDSPPEGIKKHPDEQGVFLFYLLADFAEFVVTVLHQGVAAHPGEFAQRFFQRRVDIFEQFFPVRLGAAQRFGDDFFDHAEFIQILRRELMTSQASARREASFHRILANPSGDSTE